MTKEKWQDVRDALKETGKELQKIPVSHVVLVAPFLALAVIVMFCSALFSTDRDAIGKRQGMR